MLNAARTTGYATSVCMVFPARRTASASSAAYMVAAALGSAEIAWPPAPSSARGQIFDNFILERNYSRTRAFGKASCPRSPLSAIPAIDLDQVREANPSSRTAASLGELPSGCRFQTRRSRRVGEPKLQVDAEPTER